MAARLPGVLLALLLSVAFLPLSIAAQTEAVTLQLRLSPQEATHYSEIGSSTMTLEGPGTRTGVESRYEVRRVFRVLDVGALGGMLTEYAFEDYRVTAEGRTTDRLESPWILRIDPDGRVLERIIGPEVIEDFPFPLPGRPVRVGESWSRRSGWSSGQITAQGTGTYTLVGTAQKPEGRAAQIRYTIEGTARPTTAADSLVVSRGSSRFTGEYEWLLEGGRPSRYSAEMTVTADTFITLPGIAANLRATSRGTARGALLAPEQAGVPAVGPEYAVIPGKGIGPVDLPVTVEDLARRFGASEYRFFDLGYLAWSRRWGNGLVGYVSRDDENRVIGLEIGDSRYRSEKGIGVGSSQGAVLLAYGTRPLRLEMTIPGVAPMRMLVYNEMGIAFAVVSEAVLAAGAATRIPAGLVRWMTVFPQRGAGFIYPLPGGQ